ncbi:hypothetical protein [Paenibacillus graminis]|uniref:hypothetical protein n=1 Tax=Paenibacillus graminis TaxID=189425 RepID=UPI002DB83975|nr:hypothetical protein [Paenibacillus graminis]MEC0169890.1 hypothetical protein [Paenibacillus graminis]
MTFKILKEHKYFLNIGAKRPEGFTGIMTSSEHIATYRGKKEDGTFIFEENGAELLVCPSDIRGISNF